MSRLLCGPDAVAVDRAAFNWAATQSGENPESVLYIANQPHRLPEIETQWEDIGRPLELTALTLDEFVDRCYDREAIGGTASRLAPAGWSSSRANSGPNASWSERVS